MNMSAYEVITLVLLLIITLGVSMIALPVFIVLHAFKQFKPKKEREDREPEWPFAHVDEKGNLNEKGRKEVKRTIDEIVEYEKNVDRLNLPKWLWPIIQKIRNFECLGLLHLLMYSRRTM